MSRRYEILHQTQYRYSDSVLISKHALHLEPRLLSYQQVERSEVTIKPEPAIRNTAIDYFGNKVTFFSIGIPHQELHINCRHQVEVEARIYPAPDQTPAWETVRENLRLETSQEALHRLEFTYPSPHAPSLPDLGEWTAKSFPPGRPILEAALELSHRIYEAYTFDPAATTVSTPLVDVVKKRRGVCQDFAHLAAACYRSLGIAARYVSGYIRTRPAPGEPFRHGADASHAWVSIHCPGHGWIDLDPTNDQLAGDSYITLGWGRDYSDVSLIRGVLSGGGTHSLLLSVDVRPLDEEKDELDSSEDGSLPD